VHPFRLFIPFQPGLSLISGSARTISQTSRAPKLATLWRALTRHQDSQPRSDPFRSDTPELREAEIAAVYYDHRMAGDFYEFVRAGKSRLLFALLDMAGRRADNRETLIAAQDTFRTLGAKLFAGHDFNEAIAMMNLCYAMNRTILERGVRTCPAFIGCYNEDLGTVCYANAGHTPALLRDKTGIARLEATGLPFGLFSHMTQSTSTCALAPGAALLAVSRGIVEAESAGEEFGLDRTIQAFERASGQSAHALCIDILQAIQNFARTPPTHNDVTALVLARRAPCCERHV
jgi:sigma-B regulation protein RsbU (phosphoserine phosphatase)